MKTAWVWYLWLPFVLVCSCGASCRQWARANEPLSPIAFAGPPTLADVIYTVNANSDKVRQLSTESASLSSPSAPASLRASLSIERPMRLRLRGRLIGQELDLGSNDDEFWLWAKADPDHSLYFARHSEFVQDASNMILPVGPDWLIEAMGLVNLDPSGLHEGPTERPGGGYEIRSRLERRGVSFTRVLVVDPKYGWITEQQVIDSTGRLLAHARCANYKTDPASGANLPHRVQVELPPAQMSFQLEVGTYNVNRLTGDANELFGRPAYDGYREVNLAQQSQPFVSQPPVGQTSIYAPPPATQPHTAYRLKYRGYTGQR